MNILYKIIALLLAVISVVIYLFILNSKIEKQAELILLQEQLIVNCNASVEKSSTALTAQKELININSKLCNERINEQEQIKTIIKKSRGKNEKDISDSSGKIGEFNLPVNDDPLIINKTQSRDVADYLNSIFLSLQ